MMDQLTETQLLASMAGDRRMVKTLASRIRHGRPSERVEMRKAVRGFRIFHWIALRELNKRRADQQMQVAA